MAENNLPSSGLGLLHEVVITAIIQKSGPPSHKATDGQARYLITRRAPNKKRFPGMWTVPGGKLEVSDYINLPKDTEHYWYNVLEKVLAREVKEEVDLEITNVRYVTSLATVHADPSTSSGQAATPSLVISCLADYHTGAVKLQVGEADKAEWVTAEEAKDYDLIDGILDEIKMADALRKGEKYEWKRHE